MHLPGFRQDAFGDSWKGQAMEMLQACLLYLRYMSKMDPKKDSFIHAPNYSYNEVMRMFKRMSVV